MSPRIAEAPIVCAGAILNPLDSRCLVMHLDIFAQLMTWYASIFGVPFRLRIPRRPDLLREISLFFRSSFELWQGGCKVLCG